MAWDKLNRSNKKTKVANDDKKIIYLSEGSKF